MIGPSTRSSGRPAATWRSIVNGEPGLCMRDEGRLVAAMAIATDGQHIQAVYAVLNPDKLS